MHIALVNVYFPPNSSSTSRLMKEMADECVRRGHQVTMITIADHIDERVEIAHMGALTVVRVRSGRIYGEGVPRLLRAFREVELSWTVWQAAGRYLESLSVDGVVWLSPSIFFGPLIRRLKRVWRARCYLIQRDFFPDWSAEVGVLRRGLVFRYFKHRERQNYENADVIGLQSPANLKYFHDLFAGEFDDKTEVLFNWTTDHLPRREKSSFRERFQLEGQTVFFYGGNIGIAQDLPNLVRLAEAMKNESDVSFLFVGTGTEVKALNSELGRRGLKNTKFHTAVSQEDYMTMLQEFDVGLISLDRRIGSANFPGKLLGYLQCGMPTLASINPGNDLETILRQSGAGFSAMNGDDQLLLARARQLARDPALRKRMGENARTLLHERFHVRSAAEQILRGLVGDHDRAAARPFAVRQVCQA